MIEPRPQSWCLNADLATARAIGSARHVRRPGRSPWRPACVSEDVWAGKRIVETPSTGVRPERAPRGRPAPQRAPQRQV